MMLLRSKGTLHSPLINSEDAAAAASAVKSPKSVTSSPGSQKAKPGPRPKLSLKNINKENKNEKTVKVKKPAGMSVAKENRDKVKSVKKVKNVVKKLAKGGEGKVKKVKRLGPDGKPLAKVPGAGLNKKPLKLSIHYVPGPSILWCFQKLSFSSSKFSYGCH